MKVRILLILAATTFSVVALTACSAMARHHNQLVQQFTSADSSSDPLTGEWNVSFFVHGQTTPATFVFKLDGQKVTGTCYSDHTGAGTIRDGKWVDGKLSFVLDFQKHESIAIKGGFDKDKLAGDFTTEGFTAKWEAVKK